MTNTITADDILNAIDLIIEAAESIIPTHINRMLVSDWAEEKRVIPEGLSPYYGPYSFDVNPYMREIVDCLSESSAVREVAVMKGTQITFTVGGIENWIGYVIDVAPAPMLYVTGDAGLADSQMELRIDAMIDNAGIGHKIGAQSKREGQRKTGDVKSRKEFPGGFLIAAGPNSGAKLRSFSFKDINVDEVDAFPDSTGKEGDPIYLIRRRVDAFSESYKILWGSTPLFEHNSKIKKLYEEGDKRKYFVPCKHCGHMQFLKWGKKDEPGGLKFEKDEDDRLVCEIDSDGQIISSSVRYECEDCGGSWTNSDKDYFLPRGEWRTTASPRRPGMRSYHIPGLLSPVGFRSWESAVIEFLQIKHEGFPALKFQNWVNTFLGEPFEDRGERPKIEAIMTRHRDYHVDTIPDWAEPLFLTLGADVQKNRIECEIVAWCKDFESFSINYHVIKGETEHLYDDCWQQLREIIEAEYFGMKISLSGIDSGYNTNTVYEFCDSFERGVYPVMGSDNVHKNRKYVQFFTLDDYRVPRVDINTVLMKDQIYADLTKGMREDGSFPAGYMHFPIEYDRKYFNMLTAEDVVFETKNGKSIKKYDAKSRRNEATDTRVYNLALVYAYRQSIEEGLKADGSIDEDHRMNFQEFWLYISKMK